MVRNNRIRCHTLPDREKHLKELRDSNGQCECNFFKAMGLDYKYVNDGNDVQALIEAFSKVKDIQVLI